MRRIMRETILDLLLGLQYLAWKVKLSYHSHLQPRV